MAGAPIPDDWDGLSYKCYQIMWPESENFQAILLGQLSEPICESYWDKNQGDPSVPALAVRSAFSQTSTSFLNLQECEIINPIPFFLAEIDSPQTVNTGWHLIQFDSLIQNHNFPNFSQATFSHRPTNEVLGGLWQYTAQVSLATQKPCIVRARHSTFGVIAQSPLSNAGQATVVFQYPWLAFGPEIIIEATSSEEVSVLANGVATWWSGYWVGPLEEEGE